MKSNWIVRTTAGLALAGGLLGVQAAESKLEKKELDKGMFADIHTNKGVITCELEYQKTPMTVANFVGLAEGTIANNAKPAGEPYFDGIAFHRVIKGFMVQTGDPTGTGRGGPGYQFPDEIDASLKHDRQGILSMANAGPGTNGSQFFITHAPQPHLDGKHTVFGHVVHGMDVVMAIETNDSIKKVVIRRVGDEAEKIGTDQAAFDKLRENAGQAAIQREKAGRTEVRDQIKKMFPDAQMTSSGLMYVVEAEGKGKPPTAGTLLTVHYTGKLLNGKVFDSSRQRGEPFQFSVGSRQVIPGWDMAFLQMTKGEKRTLIIPPELAYGSRGAGGVIPPNAWLIFEVELISF